MFSTNRKFKKICIWSLCTCVLITLGLITVANYAIKRSASACVYTDLDKVPYRKVGLLLGTSPYLSNGEENLYFKYRIQAAARLYHAGKISHILISGDNCRKDYNEPEAMKHALMKEGVPDTCMTLDFAGFRTLDSVVRAKEVFGQNEILIISQKFHNERAIYIAHYNNINAISFNAQDVNLYTGFKTNIRELLARVKVFVDIIFGVQPHFLGEKVIID